MRLSGIWKLLFPIFFLPVGVLGASYLWDNGYLGSYWKRYNTLYDPRLHAVRCLDENGELTDEIVPPCFVMTLRGMKAMDRYKSNCMDNGGKQEDCTSKAYDWLISKRPSR